MQRPFWSDDAGNGADGDAAGGAIFLKQQMLAQTVTLSGCELCEPIANNL